VFLVLGDRDSNAPSRRHPFIYRGEIAKWHAHCPIYARAQRQRGELQMMKAGLHTLCIRLTGIGAVAMASGVMAQPSVGPGGSSGTDLDLSAFEVKSDLEEDSLLKSFARLDTNTDGHITRNEAHKDSSLARQFHALDRNRDGNLSPEEFAAR
jgi:hypothetical protein